MKDQPMPPRPLPIPLTSARELFEKLKRDAALLNDDEVTSDRFFNFVITGYSLIDWIKADPAFVGFFVQPLYDNRWLKICGDLANASKHFQLNGRRIPITSAAISSQGFGVGGFGKGGYGIGEESIEIQLNDGSTINFTDLIQEVVSVWETVFS
jgi:hypothetical protein